jgi:hypothetical protein
LKNEWIPRAYEVLDKAFASQYGKSKESIELELAALENANPVWDFDTNCTIYTEFKHKYPLPKGLKKTRLKPAISILDDLWKKEDLLILQKKIHKAHIYKGSLYDSTIYDKVVVFLVSSHREDNNFIHNRVDVIFENGEIKLGNTGTLICGKCAGASALPGEECPGSGVGACDNGFVFMDKTNDVGITGDALEIVRYKEPASRYLPVYNAEC